MGMDLQKLKKLIDICRKNGVFEYKDAEIELKMSQDFQKPRSKSKQNKKEDTDSSRYSEEETLFWSANEAQ